MRSYFVLLLRNLERERLYAAINIGGLALGLASCLILGLYLRNELTYDHYIKGHEHLYRVVNEFTQNGKTEKVAPTGEFLGLVLAAGFPDVVRSAVRLRNNATRGGISLRWVDQPEKSFFWENSYFADPEVFDVLSVEAVAGDPASALREKDSIAISERVARKYFGDENAIGKLLQTEASSIRKVTLVFRDLPLNTHLKFDLLYSIDDMQQEADRPPSAPTSTGMVDTAEWRTYTYVKMAPSFNPADWERISAAISSKYMAEQSRRTGKTWRSWLQPIREVHFQREVNYDLPTADRAYLFGCAAIALIILAIASINYMNLATARAARRARAVGFRKILGASRWSLVAQFLGEALLFSLVALILAVVLVEVALRFTPISRLMNSEVFLNLREEPVLALWMIGATLCVGFLSGLYPALYMSAWAPISALTSRMPTGKKSLRLREVLVLVQFTISSAAIAVMLLMMAQLHYLATRPLGFERDNRVMVLLRGTAALERVPAMRDSLMADSRIRGVTEVVQTPDLGREGGAVYSAETNDGVMEAQTVNALAIGADYEEVMGLKITQGTALSAVPTEAGLRYLVNESMAKKMRWTNPVGKRLQPSNALNPGLVTGVVADFNYKSLRHRIEPLVIVRLANTALYTADYLKPFQQRYLILEIAGADIGETLEFIGRVVERADPRHPFNYRFLDDALDAQYRADQSLQKLVGVFSGVSIFIACLGLFGLTASATERRSHEISIRKVLGATTWQIVGMMAQRTLALVLVAAVISSIAAYVAIHAWLDGFAYRATVNPLIFMLSTLIATVVAFVTIAGQSWRKANADPVDGLRHE